ncbi:MAG: hypothetical protein ABI768_00585 [Acidobacteriota bacterium]
MKSITFATALMLSIAAAHVCAQVKETGRKVEVEVPTFKSPEAALGWAKSQIAAAQKVAPLQAREEFLMKAASASQTAEAWRDASTEVRVEAALVGAEAFLGLSAPLNAQSAMARVRREDVRNTPLAAAFFERAGEAAELRGDRRSAHVAYQTGLSASPSADVRVLLLFRAGTNAFALTEYERSAGLLEEALANLPDGSARASIAEVDLGGAYARLKDRVRAEAWLHRATQSLDRSSKGGSSTTTGKDTFIPEPSSDELRKRISDVANSLRGL